MKILNIFKANKEIERLTAELATAQESAKGGAKEETEAISEANKALSKANADLEAENTQLKADLATGKQTIGTLSAQKEKAETELAAAQATIANPEGEIEKRAAIKAAEITAKLGQPPIPGTPPPANQPPKADAKGRDRFLATIKVN